MIAAIAFVCIGIVQAYLGWQLANLGWWLTCCAIRSWRRWRRARAIAVRRQRHTDIDWICGPPRLSDAHTRHLWRWRMGITTEQLDAERRRRMRGGYDVAGLP